MGCEAYYSVFGGPVGDTSLEGKVEVTGHGAFKRRGGGRGAECGARGSRLVESARSADQSAA